MASRLRMVMAGLSLALAIGADGSARAATATLSAATAPEGYTRIEFSFDRAPGAEAQLVNGVLVVTFSEPVDIKSQELARGLGALIGAVRVDPDGTAVRMALNNPVRLVTTPAGERYFVDLLPTSWNALPPPLPKDVIDELSREARLARTLKAEEARLRAKPQATLAIDGATHPTFRRLIFRLGGEAPVDYRRSGPSVVVKIGAPYAYDAAATRARLPIEFAGLDVRRADGALTVTVPAPGSGAIRGFREDGDFILDIDRDDAAAKDVSDAGHDSGHDAPDAGHAAPADAAHAPVSAQASAAAVAKAAAVAPLPSPAEAAPAMSRPVTQPARLPPASSADKPVAPPPVIATPAGDHHAPPAASAAQAKAPPAPAPAMPAAPVQAQAPAPKAPSQPSVQRAGQTVRLTLPFAKPTRAAVFQRGRTLWFVADDATPLPLERMVADSGGAILGLDVTPVDRGQAIRFRLAEPRLVSVSLEGSDWVVSLGEDVAPRGGAVELAPATDRDGRAAVAADLPDLGMVRSIRDPDVGDMLSIATLGGPVRGVPVARQFVEFSALATAQGLALAIQDDAVQVTASIERIMVEKSGGLTLSPTVTAAAAAPGAPAGDLVLGAESWFAETSRPFAEREIELSRGAAMSSIEDRPAARLALAKFYMARGKAADANGVLGAIVEDGGLSERDPQVGIMRGAAAVELRRPESAIVILSGPGVRTRPEAALWRAAAQEMSGRTELARAALKDGAAAMDGMPAELKARFTALGVRLALEAGDAASAEALYQDLEILPMTEGVGAREILRARVELAAGAKEKAAAALAAVARRGEPAAAAEAELRSIGLGLEMGTLTKEAATERLERLTTGWRGDRVEADALSRLIDLYGEAGRWRDAFSTLRTAVEAFPDSEDTRALQDKMQERFSDLFLSNGVEKMPKLDALALFYDFKELLPGGRRGDELVRRLADKLVEVDLLDQAADLLNYQVDNRLSGAARAQVAARAALVDLMNGKPAKAVEVLRKTRQADLPASLLKARTRLEARALAETGRVDLALEMAEALDQPEQRRVKADILWSARRWPEAGEALEAALGSVWRGPDALEPAQRTDVMRAAIASALAGDGLAVDRVRQKYAAKMANSPEAAAFDIVTAPIEARGDAFREIARSVAASASFQAFLDEYRRGANQPVGADAATDAKKPGGKA